MPSYHFSHAIVSRKKGQSVVASAAYRSGTELEDVRAGKTFDYTRRSGVLHAEIITPDNTPDWMCDRERLWNAVEAAEKRKDAQLARHIEVALPHELTPEQRLELVREFVRDEFVSKGMIADIAMHAPDRDGDQRNYHAHILLTMRVLTGDGFGNKCREWNPDFTRAQEDGRAKTGFVVQTSQLEEWRESWADYTNRALEREGIEARVDHRSLADQGADREPEIHLGWAASEMMRRDQETDRGDELRAIRERNEERARLTAEIQANEIALAAEWDRALAAAAIEKAQQQDQAEKVTANENFKVAEQEVAPVARPEPTTERQLGKVASEIHRAWGRTESGDGFTAALEDKGLTLAMVTAGEASTSELAHALGREFGRYAPRLEEGELVVVDRFGGVHQINQRNTGEARADIDQRLATVDRAVLLTVSDARGALRQMRREQFIAEKQAERPASAVETKILDAERQAGKDSVAFIAQLDKAGLSLAIVKAEDVKPLTAEHECYVAFARAGTKARYAPKVHEGELVAVNRYGGISRINPQRLDVAELVSRATEGGRPPASVEESRAAHAAERDRQRYERERAFRARQDEHNIKRALADTKWQVRRAGRAALAAPGVAVDTTAQTIGDGIRVATIAGRVMAFGAFVADILGGLFAPPPRITAAQMAIDANARREFYRQLAADRQRDAALDRIRADINAGKNLDEASVRQLSYTDLQNIKSRGDAGLIALIEEREQQLKRDRGGGRTRER